MENTIVKSLIYNNQVRLYFIDNSKLINDILYLNKETNHNLQLLLGKTISVVSLLSGTLKGDQRISLQMIMSNQCYKVFADADANGNVRGYLNENLIKMPFEYSSELSLNDIIGPKGTIRVIKGSEMNQFIGITDMPYRNIVDDIAHYFKQSEQTQTFLGVNIRHDNDELKSNAVFGQLLPGAPVELIDEIKETFSANQEFFFGLDKFSRNNIENKISDIFKDARVIGYSPVQFFCGCSKEMFYGMLYSLSEDEILHAHDIDTACQICGRKYHFHYHEIQQLLSQ